MLSPFSLRIAPGRRMPRWKDAADMAAKGTPGAAKCLSLRELPWSVCWWSESRREQLASQEFGWRTLSGLELVEGRQCVAGGGDSGYRRAIP
jgi:hypothetical protein